jgi:membrane-associated phospholipid phosphatase
VAFHTGSSSARKTGRLFKDAVALAIAWSRVFLGLHFVSDVALGLFLGATCAVVTVRLLGGLSPKAVLATSIKREPGAGNH